MSQQRSFRDLMEDYRTNPSKWQVIRTEMAPSLNIRNKGGSSVQELLEHVETGERLVRHTLLKADGALFELPHFRPYWK